MRDIHKLTTVFPFHAANGSHYYLGPVDINRGLGLGYRTVNDKVASGYHGPETEFAERIFEC